MAEASWQGEHGSRPMTRYDVVCIHTIVGNPPAHAAHFSTRADGLIYQSRDTALRSGANLDGNHRVIAVENDDQGPEFGDWNESDGRAVPGFTAAQVEAVARICAWAHRTHDIPLVPCPDSRPTSRGIAYHRQGIDGNWAGYAYGGRVSGGELWTESRGKVCPGDRRITQLLTEIIPRAQELANPVDLPSVDVSEEDDVKISFVHGDGARPWSDAVFLVESDANGMRRRHLHPNEWFILVANGAKLVQRPQAWVDSIPWGDQPGLEPWNSQVR